MEPFLAIGEILKDKGHHIICAFPDQFRDLVEDSNMDFASLGTKFIQMLDSNVGRTFLGGGGSGLKKFFAFVKLAIWQRKINKELVSKQYEIIERERPDRIVHNGKAMYPVIWGLDNRGMTTLISPVPYLHYVKNHTHVAFNSNFGPFLNKLTYSIANYGLIKTIMISIKWLKITRGISQKQIQNALFSNDAIYTISPSLFQRPDYWRENIKVLGYHERNKILNWHPDNKLNDFLNKHLKILFITFGSMTNPEPEEKTRLILEILERNNIPAIINTASGGLIKPDKFDSKLFYFIPRIPYDWILPKIYGVIHHGGSGTTHMALKYGCATLIIPHIIDQFVWNKIIYSKGAGPKGIKIGKITSKNLEPKILELVDNSSFKKKAEQIGSKMRKEDFKGDIYKFIIEK